MKTLILAAALALTSAGCIVHGNGHAHTRVEVEQGHRHSDDCGHYQHDGYWAHAQGHHHAGGCGHQYRDGIWISMR